MDLVLAEYIQRGSVALGAFPGPVRCFCRGSDPWRPNPQQQHSQGGEGQSCASPTKNGSSVCQWYGSIHSLHSMQRIRISGSMKQICGTRDLSLTVQRVAPDHL